MADQCCGEMDGRCDNQSTDLQSFGDEYDRNVSNRSYSRRQQSNNADCIGKSHKGRDQFLATYLERHAKGEYETVDSPCGQTRVMDLNHWWRVYRPCVSCQETGAGIQYDSYLS